MRQPREEGTDKVVGKNVISFTSAVRRRASRTSSERKPSSSTAATTTRRTSGSFKSRNPFPSWYPSRTAQFGRDTLASCTRASCRIYSRSHSDPTTSDLPLIRLRYFLARIVRFFHVSACAFKADSNVNGR